MSPRTKQQFEEIRDASRSKILDASLRLFGTKGYDSTSINDIVGQAGISRGLMYHYFESKEHLLQELINSLTQKADRSIKNLESEDPRDTIRNFIQLFFEEMRSNFESWKLIMNLSVQIERFQFVHDLALSKMKAYLELFEALLTDLGWPDAAAEAKLLGALFDGIGVQYFILKDDYHLQEMERILIDKYCK